MLRRLFLSIVLLVASAATALAAYPYDSIAEIRVPVAGGYSGGSATLIAMNETQGLLLTCQHVVERVGAKVLIFWPATGEKLEGRVISIGPNGLDVALVVCPRPKDLRAVPVTPLDPCKTESILNAGFPGIKGVLGWQFGKVTDLTEVDLRYTCRPVPGMSGGATLDQWGNLVGVIQYYSKDGGGSTSGRKMFEFLRDFILSSKAGWGADMPTMSATLEPGPPEAEITAPSQWVDFMVYLYEQYESGPLQDMLDKTPNPADLME